MEMLQAELERIRRENEALKDMVEIMVKKFSVLQANVQETKGQQVATKFDRSKYLFYDDNVQDNSKKRARTHQEFPITKQAVPSQIFVRTDCKDNSLVSLYVFKSTLCILINRTFNFKFKLHCTASSLCFFFVTERHFLFSVL